MASTCSVGVSTFVIRVYVANLKPKSRIAIYFPRKTLLRGVLENNELKHVV